MKHHSGLSMRSLAVALAMGVAATSPAIAQGDNAGLGRSGHFDIAAGDLRAALSAYSQATGVQVVLPPAAAGRHTAGVSGDRTAREALTLLLRGTGLAPHMSGNIVVLAADPTAGRVPAERAAPAEASVTTGIEQQSGATPASSSDIVVSG